MKKDLMLFYGVFAYLVFLLTIAYCVGFFGNLFVARTIDAALLVNLGLLVGFALQHSGMARKPFKRWLHARMSRCLERSTYVLASSVALVGVMAFWQPMGGVVWAFNSVVLTTVIHVAYFAGWGTMFFATFLIDHFELFGLSQAWTAYQGGESDDPRFRAPGLYRHVRHPIYLGWLSGRLR